MMRSGRACWPLGVVALLVSASGLRAQQSLSPPIGGAIGDTSTVYTESTETGPSSTLAPGANDLTSSYIRTGITDPLKFLLESGGMSPYVRGYPENNLTFGAMSGTLNDPLVALQFGEYRNNNTQMAGVVANRSIASGVAASNGTAAFASSRDAGATVAFGHAARSAVAGSSMDAAVQGLGGGAPDALSMAAGTPGSAGGISPAAGGAVAGAGPEAVGAMGDATGTGAGGTGSGMGSGTGTAGTADMSAMMGGSADTMPIGPTPGSTFPDLASSTSSPTGFADSTMGTAGLPSEAPGPGVSPLLSSRGEEGGSPFASITEGGSFLHPSLRQSSTGIKAQERMTEARVRERARQQRLDYMIKHPGAPLPSVFEQQRMERNYLEHPDDSRRRRVPTIAGTHTP